QTADAVPLTGAEIIGDLLADQDRPVVPHGHLRVVAGDPLGTGLRARPARLSEDRGQDQRRHGTRHGRADQRQPDGASHGRRLPSISADTAAARAPRTPPSRPAVRAPGSAREDALTCLAMRPAAPPGRAIVIPPAPAPASGNVPPPRAGSPIPGVIPPAQRASAAILEAVSATGHRPLDRAHTYGTNQCPASTASAHRITRSGRQPRASQPKPNPHLSAAACAAALR